ncbi:MAG: hypothetical protein WA951_03265, partial [Leeuwenhoekiella sp.]
MVTKNYVINLLYSKKFFFKFTLLLFFSIVSSYGATSVEPNTTLRSALEEKNYLNTPPQEVKRLNFSQTTLSFSGLQGAAIANKTVTLSASEGTPSVVLSDDPDSSSWLILPTNPTLGELSFGVRNDLAPGTYSTTVFAIDQPNTGYTNAQISITLEVSGTTSGPSITTNVDELLFETVT